MGAVLTKKQQPSPPSPTTPSKSPKAQVPAVTPPKPAEPAPPKPAEPAPPKPALESALHNPNHPERRDSERRVSFEEGTEFPTLSGISTKGHQEVSMKKIVDTMYAKILADPFLAPFFTGINMTLLKHQQEKVMTFAFGGPELLADEAPDMDMRKLHWRLIDSMGLNTDHFEAFVKHFEEALDEIGDAIPEDTRHKGLALIKSTRPMFQPQK